MYFGQQLVMCSKIKELSVNVHYIDPSTLQIRIEQVKRVYSIMVLFITVFLRDTLPGNDHLSMFFFCLLICQQTQRKKFIF